MINGIIRKYIIFNIYYFPVCHVQGSVETNSLTIALLMQIINEYRNITTQLLPSAAVICEEHIMLRHDINMCVEQLNS